MLFSPGDRWDLLVFVLLPLLRLGPVLARPQIVPRQQTAPPLLLKNVKHFVQKSTIKCQIVKCKFPSRKRQIKISGWQRGFPSLSPLFHSPFLYLRLPPEGVLVQRRKGRGRRTGDGDFLLLIFPANSADLAQESFFVDARLQESEDKL